MRDFLAVLSTRYRRLQRREKALVAFLGIFLAVLALWQGLAALHAGADRAARRYQEASAQLGWMQAQKAALKVLAQKASAPVDSAALPARVSALAQEYQIIPRRLEPGEEGVAVLLENVPFSQFVLWSDRLSREAGVRIVRATLTRQEGAQGRISADLLLK